MKKNNAAPVCEGAIVTALTVLLLTMGMYVPVLGSFCGLVSGIPLLWLMIRRSTGVSVAALVASLALIFALTGDIISGPLSAFILLLPYMTAGYCIGRDIKYFPTLCAVTAAVLFGNIIDIMLLNAMSGGNAVNQMLDGAAETMKNTVGQYAAADAGGQLMSAVTDALDRTKQTVLSYFPTIMIVASVILGYILLSLGIFFAARLRIKKYNYVKFCMIRLPKSTVIIAIILMLITFFTNDDTVYTLALRNITALLSFAFAVEGLSYADFKLKNKIQSGYKRFLVYLLVAVLGYIFISLIFYALMLVGMLDANLDLRAIRRAGGSHEE